MRCMESMAIDVVACDFGVESVRGQRDDSKTRQSCGLDIINYWLL